MPARKIRAELKKHFFVIFSPAGSEGSFLETFREMPPGNVGTTQGGDFKLVVPEIQVVLVFSKYLPKKYGQIPKKYSFEQEEVYFMDDSWQDSVPEENEARFSNCTFCTFFNSFLEGKWGIAQKKYFFFQVNFPVSFFWLE